MMPKNHRWRIYAMALLVASLFLLGVIFDPAISETRGAPNDDIISYYGFLWSVFFGCFGGVCSVVIVLRTCKSPDFSIMWQWVLSVVARNRWLFFCAVLFCFCAFYVLGIWRPFILIGGLLSGFLVSGLLVPEVVYGNNGNIRR